MRSPFYYLAIKLVYPKGKATRLGGRVKRRHDNQGGYVLLQGLGEQGVRTASAVVTMNAAILSVKRPFKRTVRGKREAFGVSEDDRGVIVPFI